MLTIEADVEKYLIRKVKALGGKCFKLPAVYEEGMPDRLVILPGSQVAFIELKRPKGGRLAPLQVKHISDLMDLGVRACVCINKNEIDVVLNDMVEAGKENVRLQAERRKAYEDEIQ